MLQDNKKIFCLRALKPYYKNPETCGYNGTQCTYLTDDGRMCVAGKFMQNPAMYKDSGAGIKQILKEVPQFKLFNLEAVGVLSDAEWTRLQSIHDCIAQGNSMHEMKGLIDDLGLFTMEELEAYENNK